MPRRRPGEPTALENAEALAVEVIATIVPYLREQTPYLHASELEEQAMRVCRAIDSVPTPTEVQTMQRKKYYLQTKGIL